MKRSLGSVLFVCVAAGFAATAHSAVEYVRICALYGADFYYVPGTDTCINSRTGDMRVATTGGVWRSWMPGEKTFVRQPKAACRQGQGSEVR
jgi:hypothetical protein